MLIWGRLGIYRDEGYKGNLSLYLILNVAVNLKLFYKEKKIRYFGEEICAFILREGLESWKRF